MNALQSAARPAPVTYDPAAMAAAQEKLRKKQLRDLAAKRAKLQGPAGNPASGMGQKPMPSSVGGLVKSTFQSDSYNR